MQIKKTPSQKRIVALQVFLIIILGLAVYSNSIDGGFIWDDYFQVKENTYIKSFSHLSDIFSKDMGAGAGISAPFYRPLQTASYAIDHFLYGLDPAGFHFSNILLHILVALSFFWIVHMLFFYRSLAFLAGILFVLHPVNTEAVSFISDRAESLAALFMLLSMISYVKYAESANFKTYLLSLGCFFLALLSKENALILPFIMLLYHYIFRIKAKFNNFFGLSVVILMYLCVRYFIIKPEVYSEPVNIILHRIPGFFAAIADYLRLSILPLNLHMEYSFSFFRFSDPKVIAGIAAASILIFIAFRQRRADCLVSFSIFWFFIALIPVSNIYSVNDSYMAERWLYFPSMGLILIFSDRLLYLYENEKFKKTGVALISALLIIYSFLTISQNEYWVDPVRFYERTLKFNPFSSKVYNQLGLEYRRKGDLESSRAAFDKAVQMDEKNEAAYYNRALIYFLKGDCIKSRRDLDRAVSLGSKIEPLFRDRLDESCPQKK